MPIRTGKYTLLMQTKPGILASAVVAGKRESRGPLGEYFDRSYQDTTLGEKSWEKAEARMQKEAFSLAMEKAHCSPADIDFVFAGDLLNQCIASTYGLRDYGVPFLGQYGACSTMAQTLALSAIFVDSGAARQCAAIASSHFCSAERQFRTPLEYGGQRTPTAQWTATASGAAIVGKQVQGPYIHAVSVGSIVDYQITDPANMGAAMAPSAAQTLIRYLDDTQTQAEEYDCIITGDLGAVGAVLLQELLQKERGIDIKEQYNDCGLLLYDRNREDVHAGGSGCGCSAAVVCSYLFEQMRHGLYRNVLFIGTGALMSPTASQQGESIPGIAHLVHLKIDAPA